ncbi:hypothetical protein BaRGS_00020034 [Batillaria attramentaria]|uniref:Uncharacterized protein n=1 Tax=Batillaria attramentaria TaxID=370345 RepID=A0ABD0KNN9_9CAEN
MWRFPEPASLYISKCGANAKTADKFLPYMWPSWCNGLHFSCKWAIMAEQTRCFASASTTEMPHSRFGSGGYGDAWCLMNSMYSSKCGECLFG